MSSVYNIYEFGSFRLDEEEQQLYKDGKVVLLDNKAVQVLLLLVARGGLPVTRDEMLKTVWADSFIEPNGIDNRLSAIRHALGIKKWSLRKTVRSGAKSRPKKTDVTDPEKTEKTFDILLVPKLSAYKFIGEVRRYPKDESPKFTEPPGDPEIDHAAATGGQGRSAAEELDALSESSPSAYTAGSLAASVVGFGIALLYFERGWFYASQVIETSGQLLFVLAACLSFAILNGIGLILEVAYQFDRYGWKVVKMIPVVILLNFGAMFLALSFAVFHLPDGLNFAFGFGFLILSSASLATCLTSYSVLPNTSVVIASYDTQPAWAAFCKNVVIYFLPVFSAFALLIFCFLNSRDYFSSNLLISGILSVLWLMIFFVSYFSTNYLSDRLLTEKKGINYPYKSLYSNLLLWRAILCFLPSLAFLLWYVLSSLEKSSIR